MIGTNLKRWYSEPSTCLGGVRCRGRWYWTPYRAIAAIPQQALPHRTRCVSYNRNNE